MTYQHPSSNPLQRLRSFLLRSMRPARPRSPFRRDDGTLDLAQLVAAVPFPVFGLKGRPLGLRLRSPGRSGQGDPPTIVGVHFGYVAGPPSEPTHAIEIIQGRVARGELEAQMEDLHVIHSLVHNYGSSEQRQAYFHEGSMNRDWNLEQLKQAIRYQSTVRVGGNSVEVSLASWETPQRVLLARFVLGEAQLLAAALNVPRDSLLTALGTLVPLQEDPQALADLQRDTDDLSRMLREGPR